MILFKKISASDSGTITYEDINLPIEMNNEMIEPKKTSSGIDRNNQPETLFQPEPEHPKSFVRQGVNGGDSSIYCKEEMEKQKI